MTFTTKSFAWKNNIIMSINIINNKNIPSVGIMFYLEMNVEVFFDFR